MTVWRRSSPIWRSTGISRRRDRDIVGIRPHDDAGCPANNCILVREIPVSTDGLMVGLAGGIRCTVIGSSR
jgi:hypothetical protein